MLVGAVCVATNLPVHPASWPPPPAVSSFGAAVRDGMFGFQVQTAMKDKTPSDPSNPYMTATATMPQEGATWDKRRAGISPLVAWSDTP